MDELDLLLESMPDSTSDTPVELAPPMDPDAELALQEFSSAESPADRLEALKLLIRLMK